MPSTAEEIAAKIEGLLKDSEIDSYEPSSGCPPWLSGLYELSKRSLGIAALLGPSGISVGDPRQGGSRILPDAIALFVSTLATSLTSSSQRVSVGIPPVGKHLPLLLAATKILDSMLESYASSHNNEKGGVLIISPDLDLRAKYFDLYVKRESLQQAFPGSRLRPTGEVVTIKRNTDPSRGYCFFLPGIVLPEHIQFKPSIVLLDFRYSRLSKRVEPLVRWICGLAPNAGMIALYSLGDLDTHEQMDKTKFKDIALDHCAIASCVKYVPLRSSGSKSERIDLSLTQAANYLQRVHEVLCTDQDKKVEGLLQDILNILQENSTLDFPDMWRARWIYSVLANLPVPPVWYENSARGLGRYSLSISIQRLGSRSQLFERVGPVLGSLRMLFQRLYDLLNKDNPRTKYFKSNLADFGQRQDGQTLLLFRDRVVKNAFLCWLQLDAFSSASWINNLEAVDCSSFVSYSLSKYPRAIINGALPRKHRWILGSPIADNVKFLTYPFEIETIESQLNTFYSLDRLKEQSADRNSVIVSVSSHRMKSDVGPEVPSFALSLKKPSVNKSRLAIPEPSKPTKKVGGLEKLREALEEKEKVDKAKSEANPIENQFEQIQDIEATNMLDSSLLSESLFGELGYRAHVDSSKEGRGILYFHCDQVVECVQVADPTTVVRLMPEDLRAGDIVLRVDPMGRGSMFDHIVEVAEDQPELQYLYRFRQTWRTAMIGLKSMYLRNDRVDYHSLTKDLQAVGATIGTDLAVRFWVEDLVIGPETIESIIAVGKVSRIDAIARNGKEFDRAFRRIRGIHQSIGRRLNSAIRRSFARFAGGSDSVSDAESDDGLGLAIDEVVDTIELLEILDVEKTAEKVGGGLLGRFKKE